MTTEIIKPEDGQMALIINDKDLEKLNKIAEDANQNYAGLDPEGIVIFDEVHPEIYCQIKDIDDYKYRWTDGKIKEVKYGLEKENAKELGFVDGVDLTLNPIKPDHNEAVILSCPQSTYWNFSKYVKHLLQKNLAPQHVVTRIKVLMRQFSKGKPVPTATFEAVGLINATPKVVDAEVIETPKEETSQPQSEINQNMPRGWA